MSNDYAFGIGCYNFAPSPANLAPAWGAHFANVSACLRDAGLQDVEIDYDQNLDTVGIRAPDSDESPIRGGWGLSILLPSDASVRFRIDVPASFQRRRLPWREPTSETYTVLLQYPYYYPVAVVISEDDPDDYSPSFGVMLVRELLRERLAVSTHLTFECLGPSPFHGEAYVRPADDPVESRITLRRSPDPGGDQFAFLYDAASLSAAEALAEVHRAASDELGLYYYIMQIESNRSKTWAEIDRSVSDLIDLHRRPGVRGYAAKVLETPRQTREAFIRLTEFEQNDIERDGTFKRVYEEMYRLGASTEYFRADTEDALRRRFTFSTSQSLDLIDRFDRRAGRSFENLALLVGPLVGVLVGAALTLLLSA